MRKIIDPIIWKWWKIIVFDLVLINWALYVFRELQAAL